MKVVDARNWKWLQIAGSIILGLFIVVGFSVKSGVLQTWDAGSFSVVNSWAPSPTMDSIMIVLSLYGRELVWGGVVLGLFALGGEREKKTALTMAMVFLILIPVGWSIKTLDYRPRPYDAIADVRLLVPREVDGSFPSGHTLIVAGGAVVAWLSLRRRWSLLLVAEAMTVAISRVYVGVHYPSDILGGALLGGGVALLVCSKPDYVDKIYSKLPEGLKAAKK
ncbi:MAG: phosphatase PAP2 family protein [Candidatus Bathyarchaeota archaeon]|nr:phosphatase PAP2 family protein [Candidatus Bathyarchaeota archaeon]